MHLGTWVCIFKEAGKAWVDDKITTISAALAYYTLFSLAPLLMIAVGLISLVYGNIEASSGIMSQLREAVGDRTAAAIQDLLEGARHARDPHVTIIGLVSLLFGASGVFVELQDTLNTIWKTAGKPYSGIVEFIRTRLIALAAVVGTGVLLLVMLTVSTVLSGLSSWVPSYLVPQALWAWQLANGLLSVAFLTGLFALVFKLMPERPVAWGDVWSGALLSGFLFTLGKYLFALYIGTAGVTAGWGAAGSIVIVLVWVYYSSAIVLFGAEVSYAHARTVGSLSQRQQPPAPEAAQPLQYSWPSHGQGGPGRNTSKSQTSGERR